MHLFLLGVSHQTAPVDVRERLDFSSRDVGAAVEALASRASAVESVVLSTCNRSEIYVASENAERARTEIVEFLSAYHALPADAFAPHLCARDDGAVAQHLFRVAAGLDSIIVGEPQILGQVKHAYQAAADRQCVGPLLTKLFQSSFGVGKRVRTETTLGEGAVSVGFAAVALARKIFGRLDGRRVLVIGAGEISTLAAQHMRSQGVGEIVVANRTLAHAEALAQTVTGRAVPWNQLSATLGETDIVITATGAQRPILTRAMVEGATGRRRSAPLFIVDLAVPRDVDPAVAEIEQVFLYNVDDLQTLVHANVSRRGGEMARAEAIVDEEVARFTTWRRSRGVVPTVVALRHRFESIRKAELQRLNGKLASLSPEARERVEEVTRLMIEKLLLDPTEALKALPDQDTQAAYTDVVNRLFRLREDNGPSGAAPSDAVGVSDQPGRGSR